MSKVISAALNTCCFLTLREKHKAVNTRWIWALPMSICVRLRWMASTIVNPCVAFHCDGTLSACAAAESIFGGQLSVLNKTHVVSFASLFSWMIYVLMYWKRRCWAAGQLCLTGRRLTEWSRQMSGLSLSGRWIDPWLLSAVPPPVYHPCYQWYYDWFRQDECWSQLTHFFLHFLF